MKLPCFKKLLLILTLILALFSISFTPVNAALEPNTLDGYINKINDPSQGVGLENFSTFLTITVGQSFLTAMQGGNYTSGQSPSASTHIPGAIEVASNYINHLATRPPSSSIDYLADIGSRIGLAKPAYAEEDASTGYQGLKGVMEVWKAFRNIAYAFFVIIFVVVGFMIMFRAKLNPQTVVNLQMALPKLIVTLLLITFSYAIAGLIIDLMYLLIYLMVNTINAYYSDGYDIETFFKTNYIQLFADFAPWKIADNFSNSIQGLIPDDYDKLGTVAKALTGNFLGKTLIGLIISGAVLFSIIKLLFQLIIAYINIILQVIFGPIMLLFNALPQVNTFSTWIKNLVANAAAFPATAIMIIVGTALINPETITDDTFVPPMLNFFESTTAFLQNVIGLGIILMLPKIVQMIQETLKAKAALPAGEAIVQGIGAPISIISGGVRARRETLQRRREAQWQAQKIGQEIRGPQ